ncbi:Insulin receptor-related protein [Geodia barretti]|uniref:Tyrosine-protein kinase receptor n=1 Tax=Geodia barretti TaxID=519541 RepID=A0AA35SV63_GEOBA|nr:Insulin receptor-related protein [Geodia barretti]
MLFPSSQLQLTKVVGQGEFGLVYRGYIKTTNELVAVKTGKALLEENHKKGLLKEVSLMLNFSHPNVMRLIGLSFEGEVPLIIMPFMRKGNVLQHVRENRQRLYFTENSNQNEVEAARKTSLEMCYQISKGMSYLAKFKFVHRDLAARNCMIDENGRIKVSDFGLTEDIYRSNYYRPDSETVTEEKVPIKWMAPESIESHVFNESTDVVSYKP